MCIAGGGEHEEGAPREDGAPAPLPLGDTGQTTRIRSNRFLIGVLYLSVVCKAGTTPPPLLLLYDVIVNAVRICDLPRAPVF